MSDIKSAPTHLALPTDLAQAIQTYLGQRPAVETARLLLALETCPVCNLISSVAAPDADSAGVVTESEMVAA